MSVRFCAAILLLWTGPALYSQSYSGMECTGQPFSMPVIRAQGLAERGGAIEVICRGGEPTPVGQPVPQVTIRLTLNSQFTSRLLEGSWSEVLAAVDLPGDPENPIELACGAPGAPLSGDACAVTGTGNGVGVYSGAPGRPNLYQGKRIDPNTVEFQVPLDPTGSSDWRRIVIRNVRTNAAGLEIERDGWGYYGAYVSVRDAGGALLLPPWHVFLSFAVDGLAFTVPTPASLSSLGSHNTAILEDPGSDAQEDFRLQFTEGYQQAFRSQVQEGAGKDSYPNIAGRGDLAKAGAATQGTRLVAMFKGIPSGVRVFVKDRAETPHAKIQLIESSRPEADDSFESRNGNAHGWAEVRDGMAVWEVVERDMQDFSSAANLAIPAAVAYTQADRAEVLVEGLLGPISTFDMASDTAPLPRFKEAPKEARAFLLACPVTLDSQSAPVGNSGGGGRLNVASSCTWGAATASSWIHIVQGPSGVEYTVDPNRGGTRTGTIQVEGKTFTIIQAGTPEVAFRDIWGGIRLSRRLASDTDYAGGKLASDPVMAVHRMNGNVMVAALDGSGALWTNVYRSAGTWSEWVPGGGITQGQPALAMLGDKGVLVMRDPWNSYWTTAYTPGFGFKTWGPMGGEFSTDPVMAGCPDGSVYIVGKDKWNALWSRNSRDEVDSGWQFGGGQVKGKPAITCGSDNAAYVAVRDMWNGLWMARLEGDNWTGWYFGGGVMASDPLLAGGSGTIYALVLDSSGAAHYRPFQEGSGNRWQDWGRIGGVFQDVAPAMAGGEFYMAGRDQSNTLWWYKLNGNSWTRAGSTGLAGGPLQAAH